MDTRDTASEYRMNQAAQMIQARRESGQSIRAYCQNVGISRNTYFYWQRKLREAACHELIPAPETQRQGTSLPSGWVTCAVEKPKTQSRELTIEIGNCRVKAAANVDEALLQRVCRVLSSIC